MTSSRIAKRVRAVAIALVITFASNYAVSYAAKPTGSSIGNDENEAVSQSSARSGPAGTAKPAPPPAS